MLRKGIRLPNEYLFNVRFAQGKWTYGRRNSGAAADGSSAGRNAQPDAPQTREPGVADPPPGPFAATPPPRAGPTQTSRATRVQPGRNKQISVATAVGTHAQPGWRPTGEAGGPPHRHEGSAAPEGAGAGGRCVRGTVWRPWRARGQ